MNELKINVSNTYEVGSLQDCTKTINNLKMLGRVSTLAIAKTLYIIEENNFLTEDETIYNYAKDNFNYSRPTVANMLRVASKFLTDDRYTLWKDFEYSALLELCILNYDSILDMLEKNIINVDMTVKEIRDIVKSILSEDETDETEETKETEETEETEEKEDTHEKIKMETLENLRILISVWELDAEEKELVKAIEKGISLL